MRRRIPLLRDLPVEVSVLASIAFFVALGFGIVIPSSPLVADSFGVSALAASAVVSAFALMRFVSSPFAGAWTNRFGERNVLATGLAIVALSSLFAGLAPAVAWIWFRSLGRRSATNAVLFGFVLYVCLNLSLAFLPVALLIAIQSLVETVLQSANEERWKQVA